MTPLKARKVMLFALIFLMPGGRMGLQKQSRQKALNSFTL